MSLALVNDATAGLMFNVLILSPLFFCELELYRMTAKYKLSVSPKNDSGYNRLYRKVKIRKLSKIKIIANT